MTLYVQPHQSQYQPGASDITRRAGCTWAAGANGVGAISGGRMRPTPDAIHDLLPRSEETSPATPGWSLTDLVRAMSAYGVSLVNMSGYGWAEVVGALQAGRYVVLQGDSDQFGNGTCSGAFDGDHAIGIHPTRKVEDGTSWWWINDPICPEGRWEREDVLWRYAVKFASSIRFAAYAQPVPQLVVRWVWERRPTPPAKTATYLVYPVSGGRITGAPTQRTTPGFVDRCTAPRLVPRPGHRSRSLVRITACTHDKGRHLGLWLNARRASKVTE